MTVVASPLLTLRDLTAGYGDTTVLRDVTLDVPAGAVAALLGPNGAGKSTLLKVAAGLIPPTAGKVLAGEVDLTRAAPNQRLRRGICLIPEGRGVFGNLTVRENLILQIPKWGDSDDIEVALEAFPRLKERLSQTAGTMSGGEQQMLALSRAFLAGAKVVMLDEVSMGLAPRMVDEIFVALDQLRERGVALLVVEQYVDRALEMADVVYLLQRGAVVFAGSPDDLDKEDVMRNYLGVPAGAPSPGQRARQEPKDPS